MRFWHSMIPILMYFRAPEGGAAGGAPAAKPAAEGGAGGDDDGETKTFMTAEDFNKAATGREKRLLGSVAKLIDERIGPIADKLAGGSNGTEGSANGNGKAKDDDAVAKLRADLDRERKAREDMQRKSEEKDKRIREQKRDLALDTALERAGLTDATLREGAAAMLLRRGFVKFDEEDGEALRFADVDEYGNERDVELTKGLKQWAKSDAAKRFIPGKGLGGSGSRSNPRGPGNGSRNHQEVEPPKDPKERKTFEKAQARRTLAKGLANMWSGGLIEFDEDADE